MTITKKLLATSVSVLAIAGLLLMSVPAQAGFFDWFYSTPLNQEAAALRSVQKVQLTPETSNSGEENPVITCGSTMSVEECEDFCADFDGYQSSAGTGSCVFAGAASVSGGGTVFNPMPAPEVKQSSVSKFFKSLFGTSSSKSVTQPGNSTIPTSNPAMRVGNGGTVKPNPINTGRVIFHNDGTCTLQVIEPITGQIISSVNGVTVTNPQGGRLCNTRRVDGDSVGGYVGSGFTPTDGNTVFDIQHNEDGTCTVDLIEPVSGQSFEVSGTTVSNGDWLSCETPLGIFDIGPVTPTTPSLPTYEFKEKISQGDSGQNVTNLQSVLSKLGYYRGRIDGNYGQGTVSAVKAFQRANGQSLTTGTTVGPKTREALNSQLMELGSGKKPASNPRPTDGPNTYWIVEEGFERGTCKVSYDDGTLVGSGTIIYNTNGTSIACKIGGTYYTAN